MYEGWSPASVANCALAASDPLHVRVRHSTVLGLTQRRYCATSRERCKQELNDAVHCVCSPYFTGSVEMKISTP